MTTLASQTMKKAMMISQWRINTLYPIGKWRGGQQKIDHRELSSDMEFWNVFISRAVSPRMKHQELRKDHPYIISSICRRKKQNIGLLICRSLEYHITKAKQIVFPSTITTICERAGVGVSSKSDLFFKSATALGARVFNKIALVRGERPFGTMMTLPHPENSLGMVLLLHSMLDHLQMLE